MSKSKSQSFECPACGGRVGVSPQIQDALLANGCPLCTASVESADLKNVR